MRRKAFNFSLIYSDEYKILAAKLYLLFLSVSSYIKMSLLEFYYHFSTC